MRTKVACSVVFLMVGLASIPDRATAGPPFRTDDPVPVEYKHYEFYSFSTATRGKGDTDGAMPGFELTYGIIPNGQLQIGAAAAFDKPDRVADWRSRTRTRVRAHPGVPTGVDAEEFRPVDDLRGAVAIGSIKTPAPATRIIGSLDGCFSASSLSN